MSNTNFTLTLINVARPNGHFLAIANLRLEDGPTHLVAIRFRPGCNDWPQAGDRWEIELTGEIDQGALQAQAVIRA